MFIVSEGTTSTQACLRPKGISKSALAEESPWTQAQSPSAHRRARGFKVGDRHQRYPRKLHPVVMPLVVLQESLRTFCGSHTGRSSQRADSRTGSPSDGNSSIQRQYAKQKALVLDTPPPPKICSAVPVGPQIMAAEMSKTFVSTLCAASLDMRDQSSGAGEATEVQSVSARSLTQDMRIRNGSWKGSGTRVTSITMCTPIKRMTTEWCFERAADMAVTTNGIRSPQESGRSASFRHKIPESLLVSSFARPGSGARLQNVQASVTGQGARIVRRGLCRKHEPSKMGVGSGRNEEDAVPFGLAQGGNSRHRNVCTACRSLGCHPTLLKGFVGSLRGIQVVSKGRDPE
ncbi:hypothetical protein QBC40DRAFT_349359 [Triangularia verruculosa]|uniref:Uncharacterized protein n=1 Tax=Triangularia verruculosa TaxID=2587418 RepID=A0AAN7AUA9_9PEZI|nr:hypothetical protein QBC40DRAFT_349359 [Triangularia verruculosa]